MGLDPVTILSILTQFVKFGFKMNGKLEKAGHNADDCRSIGDLVRRLNGISELLNGAPGLDHAWTRDTAEGLNKALRRASKFVDKCEAKGALRRAFNSGDIADELRRVCNDVLLNLTAVLVPVSLSNHSALAEIKGTVAQLQAEVGRIDENVAQLRADTADNKSMFGKILHLVAAHPDADLRKQVAELVQAYQNSTEYATSSQKNKRVTQKTDVASSQSENKRETNKTDLDRAEVKIRKNNGQRDSKPPKASLSDRLAEPASVKSVTRQYGSSTNTNKASSSVYPLHEITSASKVPRETCNYKIISRLIENMTKVTSIDVHPSNTWIVTGHEGGKISIWDYQKQKTVMKRQVNKVPGKVARFIHGASQFVKETPVPHSVYSVKFVTQTEWLVVGDGNGYIYVYDYTDSKLHEVKKFKTDHESVHSLAVYPTMPYLLSSSIFDGKIILWDFSKDWKNIKEFVVKPITSMYDSGVRSVKFNPRDTNTLACVAFDNSIKVGNIKAKYSSLETKLKGPSYADYFFTRSDQHLMVTLGFDSHNAEIRDLDTGKVVHTLGVSGCKTSHIACHPTIPILVTMLDDGTVCLWDASTYRLEERVHIMDSKCRDLVFVTDTNGLIRLVVTSKTKIQIMEVNLPIANTSKRTDSGNYG